MSETRPVTKAVIPAAGLGTRFLPATKASPKEMLPVVDKPAIQFVVEEAVRAGLRDVLMITGRSKRALEDHFDRVVELEQALEASGKRELLAQVQESSDLAEVHFVRQGDPLGLGHAVWCAQHIVGDEPFAVLLPDDLMVGEPGALKQMVDAYAELGGNIVCATEVPADKTASYGIITPGARHGNATEVLGLVEKPAPADAPSRLGVVGRYILQPQVMAILDRGECGAGGEIQLTDAMAGLIGKQPFHALKVDAVRHDCGDKAGFVLANLALALDRPDLAPQIEEFLANR